MDAQIAMATCQSLKPMAYGFIVGNEQVFHWLKAALTIVLAMDMLTFIWQTKD